MKNVTPSNPGTEGELEALLRSIRSHTFSLPAGAPSPSCCELAADKTYSFPLWGYASGQSGVLMPTQKFWPVFTEHLRVKLPLL